MALAQILARRMAAKESGVRFPLESKFGGFYAI
jgi:hypothetical protein